MKKTWFGGAAAIALITILAGGASAQMGWGQQMGPGMMGGYPCQGMMGSGMGWGGQMGPGMMGPGMGYGGQMGMMGPGMMRPGMMRMLMVMDTDGEGARSLEKMQAVHARRFAAMDGNDVGRLSPEEMEGFIHGEAEERGAGPGVHPPE